MRDLYIFQRKNELVKEYFATTARSIDDPVTQPLPPIDIPMDMEEEYDEYPYENYEDYSDSTTVTIPENVTVTNSGTGFAGFDYQNEPEMSSDGAIGNWRTLVMALWHNPMFWGFAVIDLVILLMVIAYVCYFWYKIYRAKMRTVYLVEEISRCIAYSDYKIDKYIEKRTGLHQYCTQVICAVLGRPMAATAENARHLEFSCQAILSKLESFQKDEDKQMQMEITNNKQLKGQVNNLIVNKGKSSTLPTSLSYRKIDSETGTGETDMKRSRAMHTIYNIENSAVHYDVPKATPNANDPDYEPMGSCTHVTFQPPIKENDPPQEVQSFPPPEEEPLIPKSTVI